MVLILFLLERLTLESKSMQILSFFCLEVYLKLYLRLKLI
jgi:hypothetical protein